MSHELLSQKKFKIMSLKKKPQIQYLKFFKVLGWKSTTTTARSLIAGSKIQYPDELDVDESTPNATNKYS